MQHGTEPPMKERRGRNPDWSYDETVLLMELYLTAPRAERNHPEVVALSSLLRAAGRRGGRAVPESFRNPAGIAMRLRNFGKHDPAAPKVKDAGLRPGGQVDRRVWQDFGRDHAALMAEVARVRRSISVDDWMPQGRSSRGPAPTFGSRTTVVDDGRCGVYLVLIDGPIEIFAPKINTIERHALVKLGRTFDLDRRLSELACGLPPCASISYVPISFRVFSTSTDAHLFEQHLLRICDRNGWSLGGEFAYGSLDTLKTEMVRAWPLDD